MKPKHLLLAALSFSLLTLAACKKDDDDKEEQKTTAERIQAKWNVQNYTIHAYTPVQDTTATFTGLTSDYFDFRSDSKLYLSLDEELDTLDYSVVNDTTLFIKEFGLTGGNATYNIRNLSDNSLTLYTSETVAQSTIAELTFNLTK